MKKYGFIIIFTLVTVLALSTVDALTPVAYANNDELTDAINKLREDEGGELGEGSKEKVRGISKDIMDLVMIVVTAYVVISGLITAARFAGAGDDSRVKASLKSRLIWHILGLVFLANYFGLFDFLLKNVQIFSSN